MSQERSCPKEPSVVAMDLEGIPLAVGNEAKLMLGRTPDNIRR